MLTFGKRFLECCQCTQAKIKLHPVCTSRLTTFSKKRLLKELHYISQSATLSLSRFFLFFFLDSGLHRGGNDVIVKNEGNCNQREQKLRLREGPNLSTSFAQALRTDWMPVE